MISTHDRTKWLYHIQRCLMSHFVKKDINFVTINFKGDQKTIKRSNQQWTYKKYCIYTTKIIYNYSSQVKQ